MPVSPLLLSLTTALPRFKLDQGDVAAIARRIFDGPNSEIEYLLPIFENAGIEARYSCVPLDWYLKPNGWKSRNALYLENAMDLIEQAASDCLHRAGVDAEQVDAIVCVSTTGLSTPSLEARLMDRLPFRDDVERLPVFGLGCAGGTLGLARAAALAQASPGSRVLLPGFDGGLLYTGRCCAYRSTQIKEAGRRSERVLYLVGRVFLGNKCSRAEFLCLLRKGSG